MVNELRQLLRDNISSAPPDEVDLGTVLREGRRRRRRRHGLTLVAAAATVTAAVVGLSTLVDQGSDTGGEADGPPAPAAPTLRLADADPAVEGRDYRVLTSHTNEDLDRANGQYLDGVTDDGLVLFRDGPHGPDDSVRLALMDPSTGDKAWLPAAPGGGADLAPVELGSDRLLFTRPEYGNARGGQVPDAALTAMVYDRAARVWDRVSWPALPRSEGPSTGVLGPDGRLYVRVPATQGEPPPDGWPTGPDGEADDADAAGDTYALWSASLTDRADVRDEDLRVGSLAFTEKAMVWTDRTNGDSGRVHVRDLASGEVRSFDPQSGEKCNLLGLGVTGERIVLSQYCGTYAGAVRDDRVQILTTEGEQVVTIQDSGIEGALDDGDAGGVLTVESYDRDTAGTYVYDLHDNRFRRVSESVSSYQVGGPVPAGMFLWHTPVNGGKGATQWLGQMLPS